MSLIAKNDWSGKLGVHASQLALRELSTNIWDCTDIDQLEALMLQNQDLMNQAFYHNEMWHDSLKRDETRKRAELSALYREEKSYGLNR